MRPLRVERPTSLADAVALLGEHGDRAKVLSGGTDLVPNVKLLQNDPEILVSLARIPAFAGVQRLPVNGHDEVVIGAGTRLVDIAESPIVAAALPALAHAASRIASPQIRNMGTLGGNLCLDTRCRYINQSELFRDALGGCLKSHGTECHVVPGGQGCVAALSTDMAPVLTALDARVRLVGPAGERSLPMGGLYNTDGLDHTNLGPAEIVAAVHIPVPGPRSLVTYRKWAVRKSIDFPLVSVAVRIDLSDDEDTLADGMIVVGVLGPRPRKLPLAKLAGAAIDNALADKLGDMAFKRCRPLPNVPYDPGYRRERLRVEVKRAVRTFIAALID